MVHRPAGGSRQYHVPAVLRLKGPLNVAALEYALRQTVDRHEVLRTVYRQEEGTSVPADQDGRRWQLELIDGTAYAEDDAALKKQLQDLTSTAFDLSKDYMLRAALVRLGEAEHILVVTLHHIASDGWSRSLLVNDFTTFYKAYLSGTEAALPVLPVQYADYALWQRKHLQGKVLDQKITFWKEKLEGVPPVQLPTDFPRPAVQKTRGAFMGFQVDKQTAAGLQTLSQQNGATLFMTLLAAFKVLLYRYTGQADICVGTPVAGRQQQEVENLIGFFINTLALRTELNGEGSFTGLLQQVRTNTLEAYGHQEVPFEKVVEAVVKERDLSRSPIFQVMFVFRNTPEVPELEMNGIQFSREPNKHTTALFDISLFITETPHGLSGSVEYCTDLFTEATMERLATHFKTLLSSVITQPEEKDRPVAVAGNSRRTVVTG